jgi:hypothetical protein
VADTTAKILLCCGFRRTGKAMGQICQCWLRIYQDINVFFQVPISIFYVLYQFVIYLLTLPRSTVDTKQFDFAVKFIYPFGGKTPPQYLSDYRSV